MNTYYRTTDRKQVSEAEAFDERGMLRPGHVLRVPHMLRDGVPAPITDEERFAAMDARDRQLSDA